MGNDACKAGLYIEPSLPNGQVEVRVSVYKLDVTGGGLLDVLGGGLVGLYHSGVVVSGWEYAFGGHDEADKSGVFKAKPELNDDFIFYRRVIMGNVSSSGIMETVKRVALSKEWCGPRYDLFERNCNHFTSELCWALLQKRPPEWINETATGLARTSRRLRAQRRALTEGLQRYAELHGGAPPHVAAPGPAGALAFRDEFPRTFDAAWRVGMRRGLAEARRCGVGKDPEQLRKQVEESVLEAARAAAGDVAQAAACAARAAEEARARQPEAGLPAWDAAWRRLSSPLVRSWREAAAAAAAEAALREQQQLGAQLEAPRRPRSSARLSASGPSELEAAARSALAGQEDRGAQVAALLEHAAAAAARRSPGGAPLKAAADDGNGATPALQDGTGSFAAENLATTGVPTTFGGTASFATTQAPTSFPRSDDTGREAGVEPCSAASAEPADSGPPAAGAGPVFSGAYL